MLRISLEHDPHGPTIKLEGRLVGPWVQECHAFWQSTRTSEEFGHIQVDLNAVTAIDENGKALLHKIHQESGILIASGCLTKAIIDEVTARPIPKRLT